MSMSIANIRTTSCKRCAFCKYWTDRQDTHIKHKSLDIWEYDSGAREYCAKRRCDTPGSSSCDKFELKIYI